MRDPIRRRADLVRVLESLRGFSAPDAKLEQVETPTEPAVDLLTEALSREDLQDRTVLDLGTGTGRLAIGAALLGARSVVGVESDTAALEVARSNARATGAEVLWVHSDVSGYDTAAETVLLNPPFGAQRAHADRPFWTAAFDLARRGIYAFSLADSRTFIARLAVARAARIETTRPIPWELPATFPHHRKPRVPLPVDLWVLRPEHISP